MLASLFLGVAAGMRSMMPLAFVSRAIGAGKLGGPGWAGSTLAKAGTAALALGELAGDKWEKAPDRIAAPGIAARLLTGALAGAAVAAEGRGRSGALIGAAAALVSAHLTYRLRALAMREIGQTTSALAEDAIAVSAAAAGIAAAGRGR